MMTATAASTNDAELTLRERFRKATKPPRRLTFTRAGKFFMMLTIAVGLGALNTGNNLLFLLLGMMLSATIASGILSEAVLRRLRVYRRLPTRAFARRPAPGAFRLVNPRNYLSINIEASELRPRCVAGPLEGETLGERDIPFYKFWVSDSFTDERYVAIGRLFVLDAERTEEVMAPYLFPERGRYALPGLRLATRFPFGFFHKVSEVDVPLEYTVFPEPVSAQDWSADVTARFGDIQRNKVGNGEEYFGLRDWRTGEDHRRVHWKTSAKRGELVVREQEEQEQRAVMLVFVPHTGRSSEPPAAARRQFERGLGKTVGLIQDLSALNFQVGLVTPAAQVTAGGGDNHADRMMMQLATLEHAAGSPPNLSALVPGGALVAKVGIGFRAALDQCGVEFDLRLELDELDELVDEKEDA